MAIDIATAPPDLVEETVRLCAQRAGEMINYGVVERTDVGDALWDACKAAGLVQARGTDAVQKLLADALGNSECEVGPQDLSAPDMSIVSRNQIPTSPFPLDVLGPAGEWVKASAESKSAPIDYVALVLIAAAGGMIGSKIRVTPWEGWQEAIIIWAALIGPPSFSKSPSADDIREAVRVIERELNQDWETKQAEHEEQSKIAEARRAAWGNEITAALRANKECVDLPRMPDIAMPRPPAKARLWIVDSTTEKVARLLGENPGGLICFRDELAGLLGGFDKYGGSGNDRSFWIEAYGGRPYRYDRVGLKDGAIDIPFNAVSLIGALQPDRLDTMVLAGDDDGLAARPIYAWPDQVRSRRPSRVVDNTKMVAALRRLSAITFQTGDDGSLCPRVVALEADAADEFQAWYEGIQWDAKLAATGKIAGAVGKLDGALLRIALVFEYLSWAWERSNTPEPQQVSLLSVMNAKRFIDEWVRPNLERVFAEASLPEVQRHARTVGLWLLKTRPKEINARELRRLPGFPGPKDAKKLDATLEMLVDARWLIPPTTGAAHRPRKDFVVNQAVFYKMPPDADNPHVRTVKTAKTS